MAQNIPIFLETSSDFTQRLELETGVCTLRIKWNVRNETAYLTFTDRFNNTLQNIKIVPNWPLLRHLKGSIDFRGDFVAVAINSAAGNEITYENFGTDYRLLYLTPAEVQRWEDTYGAR